MAEISPDAMKRVNPDAMKRVIEIDSADDPRVAAFTSLTEAQLRSGHFTASPTFIAESPKVIRSALDAGMRPISLLCERRHIPGDAADIIARCPEIEIFTGNRDTLASITGYTLTRGVLCAMERPAEQAVEDICRDASRIVVIDSVVDTTNIGAIFRSVAALGFDAVLLTRTSCDPLNRRSIRVSMGTVFMVPWTWIDDPCSLSAMGIRTAAMALTDKSVSLDDEHLNAEPRLALIMGTEGDGLAHDVISRSDYVVRIPMAHGVDSLNVAAATAVACWQLRKR